MVGIVIVGHGRFPEELHKAAEMIVGEIKNCATVSICPGEDLQDSEKRIGEAVKNVNSGDGVIILADLFGGTACNLSLIYQETGKVEVISGVNLPMIIELTKNFKGKTFSEIAKTAMEAGIKNIDMAGRLLESRVASRKKND